MCTDRASSYWAMKAVDQMSVAFSVGAQWIVQSDVNSSGVMFSFNTESNFDKIIPINTARAYQGNIIKETINPENYQVYRLLLEVDMNDITEGDNTVSKKGYNTGRKLTFRAILLESML